MPPASRMEDTQKIKHVICVLINGERETVKSANIKKRKNERIEYRLYFWKCFVKSMFHFKFRFLVTLTHNEIWTRIKTFPFQLLGGNIIKKERT